jgi:cysteinyl-tRNA synthetase
MSKSLGNLVTIEDFLAEHSAAALRMMILNSGYRGPLTFNDEVIGQAERALERLRSALRPAFTDSGPTPGEVLQALQDQMEATRQGFSEAMDDDFNTAGALGYLFELVRAINQARDGGAEAADLGAAQDLMRELSEVFGLRLDRSPAGGAEAAPFIDLLVAVRRELRQARQYALADSIRDRLAGLGVSLEDTREGTTWKLD